MDGTDAIFVDPLQFSYVQSCIETDQNVALCFAEHLSQCTDFVHQTLPVLIGDPQSFVNVLNGESASPGTDFRVCKSLLDFLGASIKIELQFKAAAGLASDPLAMFSAWKVYKHKFTGYDKVDAIAYLETVSIDERVAFLMDHKRFHVLMPEEKVRIPTCVPAALLDLIDPELMAFYGSAVLPFVDSSHVPVHSTVWMLLLSTGNQLVCARNIAKVLMDNKYIILQETLNEYQAIPPPNCEWVEVRFGTSHHTNVPSLLERMTDVMGGFYYVNKQSVRYTAETTSIWKYGYPFDKLQDAVWAADCGLPIHFTNEKEVRDHPISEMIMDVLRQDPKRSYKGNKSMLTHRRDVCECIELIPECQFPDFYATLKPQRTKVNQDMDKLKCKCGIGIFVQRHIPQVSKRIHFTDYVMVTISKNPHFDDLCKALGSKVVSTVAFVCGAPKLGWIYCELAYVDHDFLYLDFVR